MNQVPLEAKRIIFDRMVKNDQVPTGWTIDHAEYWEVFPGDWLYTAIPEMNYQHVIVDGRRFYGEV